MVPVHMAPKAMAPSSGLRNVWAYKWKCSTKHQGFTGDVPRDLKFNMNSQETKTGDRNFSGVKGKFQKPKSRQGGNTAERNLRGWGVKVRDRKADI